MKAIALIAALALVAIAHDENEAFLRRSSIAARVNSMQKEWVADADNWVARLPKDVVRGMLGAKRTNHSSLPRKTFSAARRAAAPEAFDARTQWPECDSIKDIRDQATCGSCWAFGAVEAMSDRYCIRNKVVKRLSAEDMNSCSGYCGGCDGGYPDCAWEFWEESGVVTEDCYPYSIPGCDHHIPGSENPCGETWDTPRCKSQCTGTGSWAKEKTYAKQVYSLYGEEDFMADIAENGPIEVALDVYEDFLTYKSGIYHHTTGTYEGGHAVKALGWGVENGVKYWIIANSWNPHWGEQGYFRIRKGGDECGIESSGNAGLAAQA